MQVDLENILTEEDAMGKMQDIFHQVENNGETFVITKDGRPAVAIIDIAKLNQAENQGSVEAEVKAEPEAPVMAEKEESVVPTLNFNPPAMESTAFPTPPAIEMPTMPATPVAPEMPTAPVSSDLPPMATAEAVEVAPATLEVPAAPAAPEMPAAPVAPVAASNLPPISGSLNLPDMPQTDPSNGSPLA